MLRDCEQKRKYSIVSDTLLTFLCNACRLHSLIDFGMCFNYNLIKTLNFFFYTIWFRSLETALTKM